jgi:hypothetical protein
VIGERPHPTPPRLDRTEGEVPRDLLALPALQHGLEDLLLRPQKCHTGDEMQPGGACS